MAKPLCLKATRLESANRQTLEELIPRFLQALLHAEHRRYSSTEKRGDERAAARGETKQSLKLLS